MKLFCRKLGDLKGDQDGQTLAFGALSVFLVLLFVSLVVNVSEVAARRVQLQRSADSAAYSAALVQADCASSIAFINSAMAQVRYRMLRMSADVSIYGCLAELADRVYKTQEDSQSGGGGGGAGGLTPAEAMQVVWGDVGGSTSPDPRDLYVEAYEEAQEYLPAGRLWLRDMAKLERGIAILAQRLPAEIAYSVANAGGAELLSVFPMQRWLPRDPMPNITMIIERLSGPGGELAGWRITGPSESIEIKRVDENSWRIYHVTGGQTLGYSIIQVDEHAWEIRELTTGEELYVYQFEGEFTVTTGSGTVGVAKIPGTSPAEYWISTPDGRKRIRSNNGVIEVYSEQLGEFVQMTVTQVNVGGIPVNVNVYSPDIVLPGGKAVLHLWMPPAISIGGLLIRLSDPISVSGVLGGIRFEIRGESLSVGRRWPPLSLNDADGRWRDYYDWHEEYWWRQRITEEVANERWRYEYQERGAYLQPESNMARLLYHRDIDFPAEFVDTDRPGEEMIPNWLRCEDNPAGWISPETGKLIKLGYCIAPNQELDPTQPLSGYGEPETTFFDNVERFNLYYDQPGHPLKVLKQEYREELVNKTGGMYYQLRDCWNIRCNRGVWHDEQGKPHVCTTCWGRDHDGDGQTDVLVTTGNLTGRRGLRARGMPAPQSGLIDADCMEAGLAPHPEADKLDGDPFVPLVLTGDFFRWGVNIGVWRSRDAGVVGSFHALINQKRFGSRAVFPEAESGTDPGVGGTKPAWGYFLVSSGRPRMNYPSADGGTVNLIRFPAVEEREDWIEADAHNLYFVRNSSLAGGMDWDAVLYPTYKQILDADTAFDPLAAERGIEDIEESGVSYLYRNIASGRPMGWTASFDEYGRPNTRQMVLHIRCLGGPTSLRGGNLDYSSEEFRRFVKH